MVWLLVGLVGCEIEEDKPDPDTAEDTGDVGTDCDDDDGDGVCNDEDACDGDDLADADGDTVPDACDICVDGDDLLDADKDTVPDACDVCDGGDDTVDENGDTVPDACDLQTATIDVKQDKDGNYWRGWYVIDGSTPHISSNDNTITGEYRSGSNSYFVFDLSSQPAHSIASVELELELELEYYESSDSSETFSVWDVSTDAETLEADGYDEKIHSDLMSGVQYGGLTVTSSDVGSMLSVPLSEDAATDASAALGGDFAVGVHLDTGSSGWIRFSGSNEARTHRIVVEYLPE